MSDLSRTGVVVIGRNEGDRLKRCFRSLPPGVASIYVDSGSTDGSVAFARSMGLHVVELDMRLPFTAARARNVGWRKLASTHPSIEFVQFVDGDCEVAASWLAVAREALVHEHETAAVFGRRRERFPARSIYNKMCDDEWDTPIGLVESCGGDVLFRLVTLREARGYSDDLIAGEEPDLCLRLRRAGWQIRCLDHEMTTHDAAITSFGAFWLRTKRSGYAFAEHVWRHRGHSISSWRRQLYGIVFWGMSLPVLCLACLALYVSEGFWLTLASFFSCLFAYPAQVLRVTFKKYGEVGEYRFAAVYGVLIVVGKFAQASGVLQCWIGHLRQPNVKLIEYKG
ncbi:glycosyltransferase [Microcoleus sp. M2_D1]|uniref:glycosyltransferase n=1 Tax=Microcoleus sp. SVA1_B3 TaxID=2818950 RepID=UPI002FCEB9DD